MIEIYLFVNPLGNIVSKWSNSYYNLLKKSTEHHQRKDANSLSSFGQFADNWGCHATKGISQNNLEKRNHLFSTTYSAALDCKAAQFQGKKKRPPFFDQTARSSRLQ